MAERPGDGVDPDATVAIPSPIPKPAAAEPDPDSTVAMPAFKPGAAEPDPEGTIAMPARAPEPDPEATDPIARSPFFPQGLPQAVEPDPDATVAIPTPGKRRNPFAPKPGRDAVQADLGALGGINPLVAAANPILGAVPQIRHTLRHPDPAGLRETLSEQLESFEANAGLAGVSEEALEAARHALCALLDESASRTPWGADWAQRGLVALLLGGDTSGEKFFADLERALDQPLANAHLLEFFYACLALGYEGKFRGKEGGAAEIDLIRTRLHAHVALGRPLPADGELSERWRGVVTRTREIPAALVLWGVASAMALVLVALYLSLSAGLGALSDPVARDLAQLSPPRLPAAAAPAVPAAPLAPVARVSPLLAEEIKRGQVAVVEDAQRTTIVVTSDRLFASGSARVESGVEPILLAIASALERVPGSILVTGHTDDVPIRSARFHSNWELSTARAQSVVKLMAARVTDQVRLKAEGLADSQPVAPNDSEANRARNRRVLIILRAGT
jgi:type VI secretion system protein ImpK